VGVTGAGEPRLELLVGYVGELLLLRGLVVGDAELGEGLLGRGDGRSGAQVAGEVAAVSAQVRLRFQKPGSHRLRAEKYAANCSVIGERRSPIAADGAGSPLTARGQSDETIAFATVYENLPLICPFSGW
jgi:hypothetical protein